MKPEQSKTSRSGHANARRPRDHARSAASDRVMIASIDSFPASDPPGWIEARAHPSEETLTDDSGHKARGSGKIQAARGRAAKS